MKASQLRTLPDAGHRATVTGSKDFTGQQEVTAESAGEKETRERIREKIWHAVSSSLIPPDKQFFLDLGPESITVIKDIFKHPSDGTAIANEALLVLALEAFAEKGNTEALRFIYAIADGKVAIAGPYYIQAFQRSQELAKKHPLKDPVASKSYHIKRASEYQKGEKVIFTLDTYFPSDSMGVLYHVNVGTETVVAEAVQEGWSSDCVNLSIPKLGVKEVSVKNIDSLEEGQGEIFRYIGDDWVYCRNDPHGWILFDLGSEHRILLNDDTLLEGRISSCVSCLTEIGSRVTKLTIKDRLIGKDEIKSVWYRRPSKDAIYRVPD